MSDINSASEVNDGDWTRSYFNYFTDVEEHFQKARGTGLFLLSPLDWALIENWRNAGIPLEAVLKGIDDAFEKWRSRKATRHAINSVAYCTQAVMRAAERTRATAQPQLSPDRAPFTGDELRRHLGRASAQLRQRSEAPFQAIAAALDEITANIQENVNDLEELERRLAAMEDKMIAAARSIQSEDELYAIRHALERELRPYRGKMTADQLAMLERRYLDTAVLERTELPRLSLFYLR